MYLSTVTASVCTMTKAMIMMTKVMIKMTTMIMMMTIMMVIRVWSVISVVITDIANDIGNVIIIKTTVLSSI